VPIVKITNLSEAGITLDIEPELLKPSAWSDGRNVSFQNGCVFKANGYESSAALGAPQIPPYFVLSGKDGIDQNEYTFYAGANKAYAIIGSTHINITRTSGAGADVDYSATANNAWSGGFLNGILVVNNPSNEPQFWARATSTVRLQNLTDWTASNRASVIRPFKNYLIAFDVTKGATRYPQLVKWSDAAIPGSVPTSWNETDPTTDAGEFTLAETYDFCVDALPLKSVMIVYKEYTTWVMQYIGFPSIFRFDKLFAESGILGRNCVCEIYGRHIVLTQNDVIMHDGQQLQSIADKRVKEAIFSNINSDSARRCFIMASRFKKEVWVCIPVTSFYPDTAFVYSFTENTWTKRDLPNTNFMTVGISVDVSAAQIWDTTSGTWDSHTELWNLNSINTDVIIGASSESNKLYLMDSGLTKDGEEYTATVQRQGLAFANQNLDPDNQSLKLIRSIRPLISASTSVLVNISLGTQMEVDDAVDWSQEVSFNNQTDRQAYFYRTGRVFGVRFKTNSGPKWKLKRFDIDLQQIGDLP
jgi:hypothetical protein